MESRPGVGRAAVAQMWRAEDWALAGWVAIAAPLLTAAQGTSGELLPANRPLDGVLGLAAIAGAVACLAVRRPVRDTAGAGFLTSAAVGPFSGGLLLVIASTATALDISSGVGLAGVGILVVLAVALRLRAGPAPASVRRLLMTPFVLVTGTLFWRLVHAITAGGVLDQLRGLSLSGLQANLGMVGFLVAASAVYYAMLVAAPRQVAEREGGIVAWAVRYLLFAAGVTFGIAWLPILGG
ncbi:MAG: hypothetical protein ACYDAN_07335 [Candidatus Limnocylindrales bacterium]